MTTYEGVAFVHGGRVRVRGNELGTNLLKEEKGREAIMGQL